MGRAFRLILALSLVSSIIYGWHWLLMDRLVELPAWSEPWAALGRWTIIAGALSMPLALALGRTLSPRLTRWWLTGPAYAWMGFGFLALTNVALSEAVLAILGLVTDLDPASTEVLRVRALVVLALTTGLTLVGLVGALGPRHRRVEVEITGLPPAFDGYRIVQLSDIHIGPLLGRSFAAKLRDRVNAIAPDAVAITGDLVDGSVEHVGAEVAPFGGLESKDGTFFVTGNHDFYSGANPWCARVAELGIRVLRNEGVALEREGQRLYLAGVDDHRGDPLMGSGSGEDLEAALAKRPDDSPVVLLAHDPATFRRARRMGVDLQISGHTHDGQIWPFGYLVRLTVPWVAGLYREGPAQIYVSRGTGFWGPPIRVGAPAEITELTLRAAST